jgi:hypothetical protein
MDCKEEYTIKLSIFVYQFDQRKMKMKRLREEPIPVAQHCGEEATTNERSGSIL